jgi:hypothetical protein
MFVTLCATTARADLIHHITNGNFNAGMTGWTATDWSVSTSPPDLSHQEYAVTSGNAPGTRTLFQEFTLPGQLTSAEFSWRDVYDSGGINWSDGAHEFRVMLSEAGGVNPVEFYSSASTPLLQDSGPNNRVFDVTSFALDHAGQTIRVSFETVFSVASDNATVLAKVDTVEFATNSVPEPSSFLLASIPMAALALHRRRARRTGRRGS